MPKILHADWSNRPRTAFRRWIQAVHQVAAIQVGRHRFLACPYRFLAATRQAKAEIFPRAISTTELPSNPSPLTFRNNQIQILQTSSTPATMAAKVSQQDTNTRGTSLSHARTHIQRETKADSPAAHSRMGGEINVVLQQQRMVNWDLSLASHNMCASSLFLWGHRSQSLCSMFMYEGLGTSSLDYCVMDYLW